MDVNRAEKDFTGRIFRPGDDNARKNPGALLASGGASQAGQSSGSSIEASSAENRKLKRKLEKFEAMLDLQKKASSEENGDES